MIYKEKKVSKKRREKKKKEKKKIVKKLLLVKFMGKLGDSNKHTGRWWCSDG